MIRGFVSRRSSQRIPLQVEIGIQFALEGKETIIANTTNLSPEGVRFFLPKGTIKLAPDEVIELVFHLANRGEITVQGEICYFSNAVDGDLKPVIYYGVKFINISPEDEVAIQNFCEVQLSGETEPDVETAATLATEQAVTQTIDTEEETKVDFALNSELTTAETDDVKIPVEEATPTIPAFTDDENVFHSLSQEIIDQIVQSMQPQQPNHEEPSKALIPEVSPVSEESPAPANLTEPPKQDLPVLESSQNEDILEKIRKLAESINLKFDEELFHTDPKSTDQSSPSLDFGTSPVPEVEEAIDHSLDNNFLNFLDHPVGQDAAQEEEDQPVEEVLPEMATSLFKPSSQASLIDVLYGEEPSKQTALNDQPTDNPTGLTKAGESKKVEKASILKPFSEPSVTALKDQKEQKVPPVIKTVEQIKTPVAKEVIPPVPTPPAPEEPTHNPGNAQHFFNTAGNKSSSVSMDQRMIDQIIQSMTKKNK